MKSQLPWLGSCLAPDTLRQFNKTNRGVFCLLNSWMMDEVKLKLLMIVLNVVRTDPHLITNPHSVPCDYFVPWLWGCNNLFNKMGCYIPRYQSYCVSETDYKNTYWNMCQALNLKPWSFFWIWEIFFLTGTLRYTGIHFFLSLSCVFFFSLSFVCFQKLNHSTKTHTKNLKQTSNS